MARRRSFKILIIIVAVILLGVGGLATYIGYSFYFRPLPKTSGARQVAGLHNAVSIYRDDWAIPQIYATNTDDLFFAQGYVQAQERWWQMELSRYLGMGRLHEMVTSQSLVLDADQWMLMLGLEDAAKADWANASPEVKAALTAFSAGINAYIQDRSVETLATEYGLIGLSGQYDNLLAYLGRNIEVAPWEPYHSLLLLRLFAYGLDGNLWSELENATLSQTLSPHLLTSYLVSYPYDQQPTTLSLAELNLRPDDALSPQTPIFPADLTYTEAFSALRERFIGHATPDLMALLGFRSRLGGNAWVVSGIHTHSGKPLLGNDLQLPNEIPSPWFEMGLHCTTASAECPYLVVGFSLPGIPGIMVGHNDRISWGLNSSQADVQDLYLLRLNPNNPTQYEVDGRWEDMEAHTINFNLEDNDDEDDEPETFTFTYYKTRYGPVITQIEGVFDDPILAEADYQAIALRWSVADQNSSMGAILALDHAQNWNEFRAALSNWRLPAMHLVYADIDGNIGYQMVGAIPIRSSLHSGLAPAPGWESRYTWQGLIPFDLLPSFQNPQDGMIVDAGNANVPPAYYAWLARQLSTRDPLRYPDPNALNLNFSNEWLMGYQAERITTLLDAVEKHSVDSFAQIQADLRDNFAVDLLPSLFALSFETSEFQDALDWFQTWDMQNHMDSPQAALFAVFWSELSRLAFAKQIGTQIATTDLSMWAITQLLDHPQHEWWDDPSTTFTQESRDDILKQAFINAYSILIDLQGTEPSEWRWGTLHQAKFISRIIGQQDFLPNNPAINSGPYPANQGPFETSGSPTSINTTQYILAPTTSSDFFTVVALPSYRLIIDLSDFNNSRAMHTTGQSGHPASDNYNDMIAPWRTVEYHDLRWGINQVRTDGTKRLDLQPE